MRLESASPGRGRGQGPGLGLLVAGGGGGRAGFAGLPLPRLHPQGTPSCIAKAVSAHFTQFPVFQLFMAGVHFCTLPLSHGWKRASWSGSNIGMSLNLNFFITKEKSDYAKLQNLGYQEEECIG